MRFLKGSMTKNLCLLILFILLNGCFGSMAFLGPASTTAASGASGNIARSAFTSTVSYGIKKQQANFLSNMQWRMQRKKTSKKKEPCSSFAEKTNSKICAIVIKQLNSTKAKILKRSQDQTIKDLKSSLQLKIDKKSKIKSLN